MGISFTIQKKFSIKLVLLIVIFAAGSWVEINGIWVELPVLVSKSPQQWSLPSYLTVVIQLANIGPMLYLLLTKYGKCCGRVNFEVVTIYIILLVGVIASLLLAFTWTRTTTIRGLPYSSSLIALSFFLSTVDCTSSVTFLPFMSNFPKEYMTVFYIGEGMSGFFPSILALIQGVGKQSYTCERRSVTRNVTTSLLDPNSTGYNKTINVTEVRAFYFQTEPRFSATVFFLCICAMMVCSLASFIVLVRATKHKQTSVTTDTKDESKLNDYAMELAINPPMKNDSVALATSEKADCDTENKTMPALSTKTIVFLLGLNTIINGLSNGVLPSLQSYACLPYGNNIYHLTLTLSALANPVCCFLYFYVKIKSTLGIFIAVCVYITSAGYTIGIATLSPCPIWNNSSLGGVLVLIVTVMGVGLVNYIKTSISTVLYGNRNALLWNGISVQVGSLVGAVLVFPMVNVYGMFKQSTPCKIC